MRPVKSILRALRRKGETKHRGKKVVKKPLLAVAKIMAVPGGFTFLGEGYIPARTGTGLRYPKPKKGNGEEVRKARNQRKKQRKDWPIRGFSHDSSGKIAPEHIYPSVRAAHEAAGKGDYTHTRWNGRLHQCKPEREAKAKKGQEVHTEKKGGHSVRDRRSVKLS